jgi:hypothetical protein
MTIATFHLAMVVGPSEIVRRRGSHTYCGNTRRTSISAGSSACDQAAGIERGAHRYRHIFSGHGQLEQINQAPKYIEQRVKL